jgi:adenosylcobyric acid synthase
MKIKNNAKAIMFVGTGSNTGKSIFTAALCRILKNSGYKTAPFKAQNMALNSYVTSDGLEIGRAQAFQAFAAGLKPDVRMNPVLLKPAADNLSQVIVMGKPLGNYQALNYYELRKKLKRIIHSAYDSLASEYDIIVLEGAGSPAEINLYKYDMVNMSMASYANADTYLIGDIDKGGVFASLKGTLDLLNNNHKKLIKGLIINKFRGDINLLYPAFDMFKKYYKIPFIGTVPFNHNLNVEEEDSVSINKNINSISYHKNTVNIGIIYLPHISNFTDYDAYKYEDDVHVSYITAAKHIQNYDCIIIPGTKTTAKDFDYLSKSGFVKEIKIFLKNNKTIVGVCGGFQMLGKEIIDNDKIESKYKKKKLLNFLNFKTVIKPEKKLIQISKNIFFNNISYSIKGYEIHNGESNIDKDEKFDFKENIMGTYIHGIFDNDKFRRAFINYLRCKKNLLPLKKIINYKKITEQEINNLASHISDNIDINYILKNLR